MPEGPSIVILREEVQDFTGEKILEVTGNSKEDIQRMQGQKVLSFRSWGKHFIMEYKSFAVRVHFMLFGSYSINQEKEGRLVRLGLKFKNGEINFYACSVKFIEGDLDAVYDWEADVMSDKWKPAKAKKKLLAQPQALVCDALLDQNIFAGVGNIIKNEVLFRIKLHPLSKVGALPPRKLNQLIKEARIYSFDFFEWKKQFVLKKHWLAHTKKTCPRDNIPFIKQHLGKTKRRSFYCEKCQVLMS